MNTTSNMSMSTSPKKGGKAGKVILGIVVAIIILGVGVAGGYYLGQMNKNKAVDDAKQTAKRDAQKDMEKSMANMNQPNSTTHPAKTTTDTTCNADELSLSAKANDAAAGTVTYALVMKNIGKRTCTLDGFPGVSLVNDNGNQIGSPATRATNYTQKEQTLAPGAEAQALASVADKGNFTNGECKAGATKLRVYPPNDTGYLSAATDITLWCPGFEISPVVNM